MNDLILCEEYAHLDEVNYNSMLINQADKDAICSRSKYHKSSGHNDPKRWGKTHNVAKFVQVLLASTHPRIDPID